LILYKFILSLFLTTLFFSCSGQDNNYKNYHLPLDQLITSQIIEGGNLNFLIDKSDYKLSVRNDQTVIKEFPVVLGGNPTDDKLMQGDECTPEGDFYIISKYPHKSWKKFIWINYPNDISRIKHREAKNNGVIPKGASIGGEIGIHGVPENMNSLIDLKVNWTLGCISLKNEDINEIYPYFNDQTLITIQK